MPPSTDWTLRRAVQQDAGAMAACLDAAYAVYADRIADLPPVSDDCAGEIDQRQVWLAETGQRVVGVLVLGPEDGFLLLANVAVHPDHHGIGLGRALLDHADAQARAQGLTELRLTTHAAMPETIGLYRRLGWRETERQGNKVFMRKVL